MVENLGEKILIIIPARNEAKTIVSLLKEVKEKAPYAGMVVVDDFSDDGTGKIARDSGVQVLPLPVNLGIGGAVQTGFKYAVENGYTIALQVDGDGQHDPGEIEKIIQPILEGKADVVIGSRYVTKTSYKTEFPRRVGMLIFRIISFVSTGQVIHDTTSGFRALNRPAVRFFSKWYPVDFPDAEAIVLLRRAGFRIIEVPVTMRQRAHGKSSTTFLKSVYYPFKVFLSVFVTLLRKKPEVEEE